MVGVVQVSARLTCHWLQAEKHNLAAELGEQPPADLSAAAPPSTPGTLAQVQHADRPLRIERPPVVCPTPSSSGTSGLPTGELDTAKERPANAGARRVDDFECVVCWEAAPGILFQPCGHLCTGIDVAG